MGELWTERCEVQSYIFLPEVSPIEFNGIYSQVSEYRIAV